MLFPKRDQTCVVILEKLLKEWRSFVGAEKEKGLVPLRVQGLSQANQEYYTTHPVHYQVIADAYTNWHNQQHQISCDNASVYHFNTPWDVDFTPNFPASTRENVLDGFLTES